MYSTTTIIKNSRFNGQHLGTHQRIDLAARRLLAKANSGRRYFPGEKEILHFEGTRGPDGLKRKSPGVDEPSHEWHDTIDEDGVLKYIANHRYNLAQALKNHDQERAAFEAAWMAHMVTDGLTPAHHSIRGDKESAMEGVSAQELEKAHEKPSEAEIMKIFGAPIKGLAKGEDWRDTLQKNWQAWGLSGRLSQHIVYETGVVIIAATMPLKSMIPEVDLGKFRGQDFEKVYLENAKTLEKLKIYQKFTEKGWTTELIRQTREMLLPMIVEMVALGWYSAIEMAKNNRGDK